MLKPVNGWKKIRHAVFGFRAWTFSLHADLMWKLFWLRQVSVITAFWKPWFCRGRSCMPPDLLPNSAGPMRRITWPAMLLHQVWAISASLSSRSLEMYAAAGCFLSIGPGLRCRNLLTTWNVSRFFLLLQGQFALQGNGGQQMRNWQERLEQLSQQGMLRSLRVVDGQGPKVNIDGRECLLLCSNNYLGIAGHPALIEAMLAATRQYGTGSGASRLVSGTLPTHAALEERIACFKGTASALLFNSGYSANTGILQGLFGPDDVIFSDELNHASIIDGCRLARARTIVYPHCDVAALAELMANEKPHRKGRWLIVTDGVFSMDGDKAPLAELCELKEEHDALLMVDDAHGTGVLGKEGGAPGNISTAWIVLTCIWARLARPLAVPALILPQSRSLSIR